MVNVILYDSAIEEIESKFELPSFINLWYPIQTRYKVMGFNDHMDDTEMIEEYKYVKEQYCKYISSHQKGILDKRQDLDKMLKYVESLISKADDVSTDRKTLVYYTMRDDWLIDLYNTIVTELQKREDVDEE